MSMKDLAAHVAEHGFVVATNWFSAGALAAMDVELEDRLAARPVEAHDDGGFGRRFDVRVDVGAADGLEAVASLFAADRVVELTTAILQPGWRAEGPPLIFSTPRDGQQGWHQDSSAQEPGQFMVNRIIYPRQVHAEQGGLVLVPGSHRQGDIPQGGNHEAIPGEITILPQAGTLLIMHSRCWHRVQANRSDLPRTQVNWRARPASAPEHLGNTPVFRTGRWDFARARG